MRLKDINSRALRERWEQLDNVEERVLALEAVENVLQTGTPKNAVAATGELTFTDSITFGDTITIGVDTYEFVEAEDDGKAGNIELVTTEDETTDNLAALLIANTKGKEDVTLTSGGASKVTVTAKTKGVAGNLIATTIAVEEETTPYAFAKATLENGENGTVGKKYEVYYNGTNIYIATDNNTINDANWKYAEVSLT